MAPPLGPLLVERLQDAAYDTFDLAVAWAKRSGLRLLVPDLVAFRARGGRVAAIVGIDERGATRQGLRLLRENSNEMWIYRDAGGGTFHPKLYVFRGPNRACVIVGSSNVTRGGLYDNYEVSLLLTLGRPADEALLTSVDAYLNMLRDQSETCLKVTDELLERLNASSIVQDEDAHRDSAGADSESMAPALPFGRPTARKTKATVAAVSPRRAKPLPARLGRTAAEAPPERIASRWFKRLEPSDAQQPPGGSTNVTGVLRLTRSAFNVDQTTYFRRVLFDKASWSRTTVTGRPAEEADVLFDVRIGNTYLGRRRLRVSHAAHREAQQRNVTTVLRWGPLGQLLRGKSFVGQWVVIDQTTAGRCGLTIQSKRPEPLG